MKKLTVILAVALLAVGICAGYFHQQLGESRNQVADLQARLQKVEAAEQASAVALVEQRQRTTLNVAGPSGAPAPGTAAQGDTSQAATQRPASGLLESAKQIMSTPEGRGMVQPAVRGMVQQQYKDIGRALHLSAEEENKLLDTLARQQVDLSAASMELLTGDSSDAGARRELERKLQELQHADDTELSAMLGGKYPQFQEFQSTMAARQQVDQLKTVLGTADGGLSDAQSKHLVAALAAEQKRITEETSANPVPAGRSRQEALDLQVQRMVEANHRMVDAASAYLDATQLDSFRKMRDQQTDMLKRVLGAMGSTGTAQAQSATSAP